jgi:primosomal protein N'
MDAAPAGRHVEVAIDAAGVAGDRTWSYAVPEGLADVAPGEAVLVEWGRRRTLGIVLGDAAPPEGFTPRPLAARLRADGPLLPPLALALARSIAEHYLAPVALVIRAMLPPGLLERHDLVATALAGPAPDDDAPTSAILASLAAGPRPVRALPVGESRPALLRRLRALERAGRVHLEWTLGVAGAMPRFAGGG